MCVDPAGIYISGRFDFAGCCIKPTQAQGTVSGYTSGGYHPPSSTSAKDTIDKFPFASGGTASDVGNLTLGRFAGAGQSSLSSGYATMGAGQYTVLGNVIDKFPFASNGNATDVGDATQCKYHVAGQTSTSSGYSSGGAGPVYSIPSNVIDKFPFASDSNATDVGDLSNYDGRTYVSGQSSTESGYTAGGNFPGQSGVDIIDKFPFASDSNATDVGDLTQNKCETSGQNSREFGYVSGGRIPSSPFRSNTIEKFPFASDGNATDVAELRDEVECATGQSSTENGYLTALMTPGGREDHIDKFPFASDSGSTDVGQLSQTRTGGMGQQV
jgi:hypothetical protein